MLVCGVSGPTSSGKTTVIQLLSQVASHVRIIHLDDYYLPDSLIPVDPATGVANWDCPEALNYDKLIADVTALRLGHDVFHHSIEPKAQSPANISASQLEMLAKEMQTVGPIVFVEGFMLFNNSQLSELFDKRLFLYIDYDTSKERRHNREYVTAEGTWQDPPGYFDEIVWREYVKYCGHYFNDPPKCGCIKKETTAHFETIDTAYMDLLSLAKWVMNNLK
ncbi:nicotinamide riboside kinase [Diutina catenulata]